MKRQKTIFRIVMLMFALVCTTFAGEMRTWTGTNGKKLEAEFVSQSDGQISLKLKGGKVINTKASSLSPNDINYIKTLVQAEKAPDSKKKASKEIKLNISELHGKTPIELKQWFPNFPATKPEGMATLIGWDGWKSALLSFNAKGRLCTIAFNPSEPMSEIEAKKIIKDKYCVPLPNDYEKRVMALVAYRDMKGKIRTVNFSFVDWKTEDRRLNEIAVFFNIGYNE